MYDGEIAYADSALGNLLSYLKRENRYREALIIVVGDHGEGLENTASKLTVSSSTIQLLMFPCSSSCQLEGLPSAQEGKVVEAQVQTTDILPTVLDVLNIAPPSAFGQRSLSGYFAGTQASDRVVFGETDYPLSFGWAPLRAVRAGGFKFI